MEVHSPSSVCQTGNNVFAGRTPLYSLDSRLGDLHVSNGLKLFEPHGAFLQNVEGGFDGRRLLAAKRAG
jgi:hypothetical protein